MSAFLVPRPEHPEPQFERPHWQNLNGEWEFEIDHGMSGEERKLYKTGNLSGKITVPFCPESSLSGVGHKDFMNAVWYRREFEAKNPDTHGKTLLHFGAVDYHAVVYVNGRQAGEHKGGYTPFVLDITKLLKKGANVLTVCVKDNTRSPLVPRGKQSELYDSHGCDYTRTTGIWQTVWLEFVPEKYIKKVKLYPDHVNGTLAFTAHTEGDGLLKAEAFFEGRPIGSGEVFAMGGAVSDFIKLTEQHLWEPGNGRLYDLRLSFGADEVKSYFGLRNVRLDGGRFLINEKSVFQRLVLDQGFYPDGIYTAPADGDLVKDIELSMAAGFNGARLHQKVFEPRFLYHCDRLGYLVWGEYPNWGVDYSDPGTLFAILPEWCEAVERDFNHPSVIGWCPFNETWDYHGRQQTDDLLRIIYQTTKRLDDTRPCIDTSGNYHVVTDIYDVHDYDQNPATFKEHYDELAADGILYEQVNNRNRPRQCYNGEPVFISEYGGIQWSVGENKGWGYGNAPKTEQEFIARYKGLTDALLDNPAIFGFCYTQLYDIEQEQNGLYTYSREPKFDMAVFKAVNSRKAAIE